MNQTPFFRQWRRGFDARSVNVGFVVDKMELGPIFLPVLRFPPSVSLHLGSVIMKH